VHAVSFTKRSAFSDVIARVAKPNPSAFVVTIMFESTSMSRHALPLVIISLFAAVLPAAGQGYSAPQVYSQQVEPQPQVQRYAAAQRGGQMGGGFIEFIFNGTGEAPRQARPSYQVPQYIDPRAGQSYEQGLAPRGSMFGTPQGYQVEPARPAMDPRYLPQIVSYDGKHAPGTIVIDTPNKFLYFVEEGGRAKRYGIGVGRPGFTWAGVKSVTRKAEWPDWTPPPEMLQRRPDLPRHMAGGPENPLGARAMYLGSSLYRIHGSNEPWTIGTSVSSGCIRMRNEDVIDLYGRVKVGTKVVVI
jgi:lipoprotein-anchoring transpeptidase ErfK/SrfK